MISFHFFRQLDVYDCGPTCVQMVAKHYGRLLDIEFLRNKANLSKNGVSLLGISNACESVGLHSQGVQLSFHQLITAVPLPCILHWNESHFVVLYRVEPQRIWNPFRHNRSYKFYVADPAEGLKVYDETAFRARWEKKEKLIGVALIIEPTPEFFLQPEFYDQVRGLAFRRLISYLKPYKSFLFQLIIGVIFGSMISLFLPFLTQSVVDNGILNQNIGIVTAILFAQLFLNVGQVCNNLIQSWISLHVTSRVSIRMVTDFLSKIMRLPITFFLNRTVGDTVQRMTDQGRIQAFITGSFTNIIFSIVTTIIYTIVLLFYDVKVLAVFYIGSALYLIWIAMFLRMREEIDHKKFNTMSASQNSIIQIFSGIQEVLLNNAQTKKRWEWEKIQVKLFNISIKSLTLSQNQTLGASFIDQTKNILISFLSAKAVIDGDITIGMMLSIQYIIGHLNGPIMQFTGFIQSAQDAKISLDRLDDVYKKKDEDPNDSSFKNDVPALASLELKNVSFSYDGSTENQVLKDVTLLIQPNTVTAIVGASGSGKTTLLKLILGVYRPTKGEILLEGQPLSAFSPKIWRDNIGVVMQDGFIFSDSIANNIALSDELIDQRKLEDAIKIAELEEYVKSTKDGIMTVLGSNGQGLSGGQKQRILIARAIYKNAQFLFLDEATNSLDTLTEQQIVNNLKRLFANKTAVIIAHRLSTIKGADRILVMENGRIVEMGTHHELIQLNGYYNRLVLDQI